MEKLYTRKQAATILGIGLSTLDAAKAAGMISYVQFIKNGKIQFTETAIQEFIGRSTHCRKTVKYEPTFFEHKAASK